MKKVVIAHRGAPGYLPEHTLQGVAMAHSWGVDFIEPDVVLTKDECAIIMHDIFLDTTTDVAEIFPERKRVDGRFYAADFLLREIKLLKVHERIDLQTGQRVFENRFPASVSFFQVPTLEEYIELIQGLNLSSKKDIGIYPELKKPEFHLNENLDIAKVVFKILDKYGYNSKNANIFVQCFYPPTLMRLRSEFKAKMPMIALLTSNDENESSIDYDYYTSEAGIKELSLYVEGIGPDFFQVISTEGGEYRKSRLIEYAKKYNLKVHPYTHRSDSLPAFLKNDADFFKFIYEEVGADGVFTDFGDIAIKYSK